MAEPKKRKPPNRTGRTRSIYLPAAHDERLNRLVEATGLNRNALIKLWVATLTPEETYKLAERLKAATDRS